MIELTTQCPQCDYSFTVTLQQLQQRKGLSRCSQCAHIFDAYECAVTTVKSPTFVQPPVFTKAVAFDVLLRKHFIGGLPLRHGVMLAPIIQTRANKNTISSKQPIQSSEEGFSDIRVFLNKEEFSTAADPLQSQAILADNDRVMFRPELRESSGFSSSVPAKQSWTRLVWILFVWLLLICAAAQLVYVYRAQIANTVGFMRPALQLMCDKVSCDLPYMREISAIEISHSRLQEQANFDETQRHAYYLQLQLKNNLAWAQEWPTLVISFSDAAAAIMATIAIGPQQYLKDSQKGVAFQAGSQHTIRLPVSIANKKINGFSVDKYFP